MNFYSGFLDSTFNPKEEAFEKEHKAERDSLIASGKQEFFADNYLFIKYADDVKNMRAPFHLLIDHLDYIVKLVGIDYGRQWAAILTASVFRHRNWMMLRHIR